MFYSNLFLILASGEINGNGFWLIDTTNHEYPTIENKNLIECHRKELIGKESAENILYAINLNIENLYSDIKKDGYILDKPTKGISFSLPLNLLEEIFDFWLEIYKSESEWTTCIGLLKIKRRYSLSSLITSKGLKGKAKEWAPIIQNLHNYRPNISSNIKKIRDPMWK